jgi:signal transduction histidine kinase
MLGACILFVVLNAMFSWVVAAALGRGLPLAQVVAAFGRVLLSDTLFFLPVFAAVAAFNLVPGRWSTRAAVAMAVLAAGTAIPSTCPVVARACGKGVATWMHSAVGPAAFLLVVMLIARDADARSALDRERIHMLELDRGLAEARLKVTQAQIEPHFLFNTLANIRRLFEVEPASGRAMLQHFEAMLASTLPTMRDARSTLAQEIAYARAYLSVQQIRMGDRLRFGFDVPDELLGRDFPPMMLLTLVENAIKHGIGPLPQGGTMRVEAARERDVLRVRVIDSGRGLSPSSGSGVGLANIEARLRADPTGRGRLVLEQNAVGGVSATIDVALAP